MNIYKSGTRKSASEFILMLIVAIFPIFGCSSPKRRLINQESLNVDLSKDSDATLIFDGESLHYPTKAMREKVTGYVDVTFIVSKTGQPREIEVLKEEPPGYGFASSAVNQVLSLQFKPAVLNGERVLQRMKRRYNFE